ncbi:phosphoribosylaminoimidazolesuccinocarboxamide synthase, partial [Streptococcus suis]
MKTDLLYSGKAKDIYATADSDQIVAVYKDQATA